MTQTFPINDRWSQAFRLYAKNGVLHGRIAHLIEPRRGWKAMVDGGHYAELHDPDGEIHYATLKAVRRLPRTWVVVDGEERWIVPFGPLRRPSGPLTEPREDNGCALYWCSHPAALLFSGVQVCAEHNRKLTTQPSAA